MFTALRSNEGKITVEVHYRAEVVDDDDKSAPYVMLPAAWVASTIGWHYDGEKPIGEGDSPEAAITALLASRNWSRDEIAISK